MGAFVKLFITTFIFMLMTILPRAVKAETSDLKQCLRDIQTYWVNQTSAHYTGHTRMDTPCDLNMTLSPSSLKVSATGAPLSVNFEMKESNTEETLSLESCRVDKEKIHFVFEEKIVNDFEKRERVQMTLLKRQGNGLSLILSKRENKILRPLQQNSLICHLN
jgi:hypothetical protein